MKEKQNAKQFPKFFYARHMQDGIAGYENEVLLVQTEVIQDMLPSFNGKPVYIYHQDVDLDTMKETCCGYITESFYNANDGWAWVKFLVTDDEALEKIGQGWSVSNGYIPLESGDSGTQHNMPYDRKILKGEFTHLALVDNPRYEDAKIYTPEEFKAYQASMDQRLAELKNSKETKKGINMKFFKNKKEEVSKIDAETFVEVTNDKGQVTEIKVQDMIQAVLNEKEDKEEKTNMEMEVEVGEEKLPLKELINRYKDLMNKKNSEDEDEKKNASDEEEKENESEEDEKENESDEDEKENMDDEEKKNSKHFDELRNAHKKADAVVKVDLGMDQVARGKERY